MPDAFYLSSAAFGIVLSICITTIINNIINKGNN